MWGDDVVYLLQYRTWHPAQWRTLSVWVEPDEAQEYVESHPEDFPNGWQIIPVAIMGRA